MSAGEEKDPKGRRFRYVPLSTGALEALEHQAERTIFTGEDDYVFCGRLGERLDDRRYGSGTRPPAPGRGLRPIKLRGLRHAAGSLRARHGTSVEVREFTGHAKLSTTDRYVSARFSEEFFGRLDVAFDGAPRSSRSGPQPTGSRVRDSAERPAG